jgi:hypothetical protein
MDDEENDEEIDHFYSLPNKSRRMTWDSHTEHMADKKCMQNVNSHTWNRHWHKLERNNEMDFIERVCHGIG